MIAELTSFRVLEELLHRGAGRRVAFLPIGCTEQHGPLLPLGTDTLVARTLAEDLCMQWERQGNAGVVYPALAYTPSRSNAGYPGSTTVAEDTFRAYVADICRSILIHDFDAIVLLSMHGPAEPSLVETAYRLNKEQCDAGAVLHPLLVLGVSRCEALFQRHLGDMVGKHADFKETVLLYRVLGNQFFDASMVSALKRLDEHYRRTAQAMIGVLGVPMERRSVEGVLGRPYPDMEVDLARLAEVLWADLVATFAAAIDQMLGDLRNL